jgi:predicted  nucleic acid-binding Zn-ribbon protein
MNGLFTYLAVAILVIAPTTAVFTASRNSASLADAEISALRTQVFNGLEAEAKANKKVDDVVHEKRKFLVESCQLEADLRREIGILKASADELEWKLQQAEGRASTQIALGEAERKGLEWKLQQAEAGLRSLEALAKAGGPDLEKYLERRLTEELKRRYPPTVSTNK